MYPVPYVPPYRHVSDLMTYLHTLARTALCGQRARLLRQNNQSIIGRRWGVSAGHSRQCASLSTLLWTQRSQHRRENGARPIATWRLFLLCGGSTPWPHQTNIPSSVCPPRSGRVDVSGAEKSPGLMFLWMSIGGLFHLLASSTPPCDGDELPWLSASHGRPKHKYDAPPRSRSGKGFLCSPIVSTSCLSHESLLSLFSFVSSVFLYLGAGHRLST